MAPPVHGPEPGKLVGGWEDDCAHCRIYRQMCVHFLGWCAVWLSALLFHTSVSCVTVFSTRLIHSVVSSQCSKATTCPRHCRDRCMIIKYKSGGTGRTSTEKWNQTDDQLKYIKSAKGKTDCQTVILSFTVKMPYDPLGTWQKCLWQGHL